MPELIENHVNGHLVSQSVVSFTRGVAAARDNYPELALRMLLDIGAWHWRDRTPGYFRTFRRLLDQTSTGRAVT